MRAVLSFGAILAAIVISGQALTHRPISAAPLQDCDKSVVQATVFCQVGTAIDCIDGPECNVPNGTGSCNAATGFDCVTWCKPSVTIFVCQTEDAPTGRKCGSQNITRNQFNFHCPSSGAACQSATTLFGSVASAVLQNCP